MDMPEMEVFIIEDPEPTGPFGAKGVGEPALIPTAPAVLNAIADALGERVYRLPANPERVRKTILKREVPSGKFPFNVGAVVSNVGTSLAIYEAVVEGKPLVDRVITVGGSGVERPKNLKVRIGTKFQDILDFCKIKKAKKNNFGRPNDGGFAVCS